MNYWDVPTSGPATLLGSLTFNYNSVTPGAFATVVTGSGFIGTPGNWVNSPDIIRITGDFFAAGDPSSIALNRCPSRRRWRHNRIGFCRFFAIRRRR